MQIGAAARAAGLTVPAVRFYESQGLLAPAPRTDGGYRRYDEADVRRLLFIRRARSLGLPLTAVRELVRAAFDEPCRDFEPRLKLALQQRIADVRQQIAELSELDTQLSELESHLTGACTCTHPAGECSGCILLGDGGHGCADCACCAAAHNMSNASSA